MQRLYSSYYQLCSQLLDLQVANGDLILERHISEGALNAQYTSKFSTVMIIECIDSWVNSKLLESLKSSPFVSILADECEDISTKEELVQYASEGSGMASQRSIS